MRIRLLFVMMILGCLGAHAQLETDTLVSLTKVNYVGIREFSEWSQFPDDQPEDKVEVDANGIAITNAKLQSQSWQTQVMVVPEGNLDLKEGHNYVVRLTVKVPSDGTYIINLGNSEGCRAIQVSVNGSDDFQIIDVEYPEYKNAAKDAHVTLDCGWVVGTTVVKEVEVFEKLGIWNGYLIELTPAKSVVYKFVRAMDDKSQKTINGLYESMKETGDKSIIKCTETGDGGWYVRKDYPLPDGNYYESAIYEADSPSFENQLIVILPQVHSTMSYRGRIDDLVEYLGDWVRVDLIKEDVIEGYEDFKSTTFRFISNLKTSEEWLSLCMDVYNHGFDGLHHFSPQCFYLDKIYKSHLISVLTDANKDENLIYSMNWEGVEYPVACKDIDDPWKTTDEGLAIVNPKMQEFAGNVWTLVNTGGFSLEENHNYVVRLTMKVPSDGKYMVAMGSWATSYSKEVSVSASDDFQIVDVPFLNYWGERTDMAFKPIEEDAHINLCSGWVVGTTVVKKVEVYEMAESGSRENTTAIKTIKTMNSDDSIYNLAGQRVSPSYKGVVIRNGRKVVN